MTIKVLPPEIAARIAAGEVVERPASVVKELLENALDAGGTIVTIQIVGGGLESIRVSDNGFGIDYQDAQILFQRHATSKIQSEHDLSKIISYGFRGEALHSLSAVAETTILTRQTTQVSGTFLQANDGKIQQISQQASRIGTTVTVNNLFSRIPARKQFLRSNKSEVSRVKSVVNHYALAYPGVQFRLIIDEHISIATSGLGDLREVATSIFGPTLGNNFLILHSSDKSDCSISGLISPPAYNRSNRANITFFVNRRPIQAKNLMFAINEAYKGFLPSGRHPAATIFLEVPPQDIDINIHPTKSEVRFKKEEFIFQSLRNHVRETLMERAPASDFRFMGFTDSTTTPSPSNPLSSEGNVPQFDNNPKFSANTFFLDSISTNNSIPFRALLPALRIIGQIRKSYIVTEGPDAIYLIDQHAAHERVLYEHLQIKSSTPSAITQGLLSPIVITLSPTEERFVNENWNLLTTHGWELEPFGEKHILLRSAPPTIIDTNLNQKFHDILDSVIGEDLKLNWSERISASMACHSAVTAGMLLPNEQMHEIVRMLEVADQPRTCPHGRPTIIRIGIKELEKEFLRK